MASRKIPLGNYRVAFEQDEVALGSELEVDARVNEVAGRHGFPAHALGAHGPFDLPHGLIAPQEGLGGPEIHGLSRDGAGREDLARQGRDPDVGARDVLLDDDGSARDRVELLQGGGIEQPAIGPAEDGGCQGAALIRSASWYASMASIVLANRNEPAMV